MGTSREEKFMLIYQKYNKLVYWIAHRYFDNIDIAIDAAQETFAKIWRLIDHIDIDRNVDSYIYVMTKNVCHDIYRKLSRINEIDIDNKPNTITETININSIINRIDLEQAIESLPPAQKDIVILTLQGYTQREIAHILNIPLGTVKTRMRAAIKNLRGRLCNPE